LTRRRLAVEEALEILSDRERSLLLDWVDGWSWEELGERYGQSVPVLQTSLTRIKRKVREGFPDVDRFELD
jgi:DNA-directed RNA polymerase specialized sigma24 family protein